MNEQQAKEKIISAANEARAHGVTPLFIVDGADWTRPLKTQAGALKKLRQYARIGLWSGTVIVLFEGADGKRYPSAFSAAKG